MSIRLIGGTCSIHGPAIMGAAITRRPLDTCTPWLGALGHSNRRSDQGDFSVMLRLLNIPVYARDQGIGAGTDASRRNKPPMPGCQP